MVINRIFIKYPLYYCEINDIISMNLFPTVRLYHPVVKKNQD